jgi:NAD(P)-dependent dehydrogenase (short-subunit alcohol dehydrogenase family)
MTHDKLEDVPLDEVKRTFDTNIFGTFSLTQAALKELKPGASILITTSIQAYQPGENLVAALAVTLKSVEPKAVLSQMPPASAQIVARNNTPSAMSKPHWTLKYPGGSRQKALRDLAA